MATGSILSLTPLISRAAFAPAELALLAINAIIHNTALSVLLLRAGQRDRCRLRRTALGIDQMNKTFFEMDEVTQQTAENFEDFARASESLKIPADQMRNYVTELVEVVGANRKEHGNGVRNLLFTVLDTLDSETSHKEMRANALMPKSRISHMSLR